MELTASNIATWTVAITRSACGGSIVRAVTKATAFSFQSVMTSAETGPARPVRIMAGIAHRSFCNMVFSFIEQEAAPPRHVRAREPDAACGQECQHGDSKLTNFAIEINGGKGNRLFHIVE